VGRFAFDTPKGVLSKKVRLRLKQICLQDCKLHWFSLPTNGFNDNASLRCSGSHLKSAGRAFNAISGSN